MPVSVLHGVSHLIAPDDRTDATLVRAFVIDSDEGAFAELVRRHGPSVLGVCRRALGPTPDAEDAFQATFLVLVRRASSTPWRAGLGPWLYGVALRVSRKVRARRSRRVSRERGEVPMVEPVAPASDPDDAGPVVDEELSGLPARYREPLVLCEVQGLSRRAAARELGVAEGTLSSRLARGRKLLRERLSRRGVVPVAGGLGVAVPSGLAGATVRHAVTALGRSSGVVPAAVLSLTEEVTKAMMAKWKLALAAVATCATLTSLGAWNTPALSVPAVRAAHAETTREQSGPAAPADTVPRVEIVARVGESSVITNHDVRGVLYQMPGARGAEALAAALGAPAGTAWHNDLPARALRKAIERELILDEMHTKLKKANKLNVVGEIQELAAQSAGRQLRALCDKIGAKSDEELVARLRTEGLTVQVIRRQTERQFMADQYVASVVKARLNGDRVTRESREAERDKFVSELWRKGTVRVFDPLARDAWKHRITFPAQEPLTEPAKK
ncbi:sigma-70 family RNA polymerase sigma factor [Gemmata sp. JC673]|uniref:Sigma-70 family RNA polymerase sigma factor n=1 Tax=Gemmata algarum TaxID=2975278 RepID=A0ABU5F6A7_9BACT|nr:sigma-70 family RNA polymerase sigma factor [Gemmata algarum]MDY3563110.1 sigma-70 family RNA polymerase sigma factor [Gemmata algarum]